eukprot:jgi/Ulvmu1/12608/UM092_0039.1
MCDEKKIAVIENEFGVVNLDAKLVSNQLRSKEDLVTISNGCICCSLRKDILTALSELKRRSTSAGQPYDNVILETTGLADPAPVAFTFFANPWVKKHYHLDSIVTVVDALHLHKHLTHAGNAADSGAVNETVNQIAFADMVLLNKIDLVSGEQLMAVEDSIRGINAIARLVHTRLDTDDCPNWITRILDNNSFSLIRALEIDPQFLDTATSSDEGDPAGEPAAAGRGAGAPVHAHAGGGSSVAGPSSAMAGIKRGEPDGGAAAGGASDADDDAAAHKSKRPRRMTRALHDLNFVRSIGILLPGALDNYLFNMFMRDLLLERGKDIFRSKGTLCIHGQKRLFNFQGVHETFQFAACKLLNKNLNHVLATDALMASLSELKGFGVSSLRTAHAVAVFTVFSFKQANEFSVLVLQFLILLAFATDTRQFRRDNEFREVFEIE